MESDNFPEGFDDINWPSGDMMRKPKEPWQDFDRRCNQADANAFASGLRYLADWVRAHPNTFADHYKSSHAWTMIDLSDRVWVNSTGDDPGERALEILRERRRTADLTDKFATNSYFGYYRNFGPGIRVSVSADRTLACEMVSTDETEEVVERAVIAPAVIEEKTVVKPKMERRCVTNFFQTGD